MSEGVVSAAEGLARLREGNRRFVSGDVGHHDLVGEARSGGGNPEKGSAGPGEVRARLLAGQSPFAVVLGCSDSRVPVEVVFDQGLGDLFVIRVAGNIVAPSQVGSVEFAAERFGTRLVVVLGHTRCGAIDATLESLQNPGTSQSSNLRSIVDRVAPSVEALLGTDLRHDRDALAREAVRANVKVSADHLRHGSSVLEGMIQNEGLRVVGAEYALETGVVEFFE